MAPKPTTAARKQALLRNRDVLAWYNDRPKIATATVQLDQLEIFLRRTHLELADLLRLARQDARGLKGLVVTFTRAEQGAGRKAKYILNVWWGVRSFLASVGAAPEWNPRVERAESDEEDAARTVPTHDQLRQIANAVKSARDRAVVYLLASSGIRIGVLASQFGPADGLRLKHLPDLVVNPEPSFLKLPFTVRVPAHLSKRKRAYYTFGSHEAADAVVTMLKERARSGERLTPDSPLVHPETRGRTSERRAKDGVSFLVRKALAERVKFAMNRVAPSGSRWSAHTLRAWFSTQMEACEARGLVSRTRREFFMGHSLGVDGDYNVDRPLSPAKLDELRETYARCEPNLSTAGATPTDGEARALRLALRIAGVPAKKLEGVDLVGKSDDEIVSIVKKLGAGPGRARQEAVPNGDVAGRLSAGWEYVGPIDGSSVVLRAPAQSGDELP